MLENITIGSFSIQVYGLMILLAFVACYFVVGARFKAFGLKTDTFYLAASALIGGILGAKILYLIVEWEGFTGAIGRLFAGTMTFASFLNQYILAGLVFYGGLIGGALGVLLYIRSTTGKPSDYVNAIMPAIPLGHAIGRVGCFLAGCCYGRPTDSAIGMVFPHISDPALAGQKLIPTQLFEVVFNLVIFAVMVAVCSPKRKRPLALGIYALMYSVMRFTLEFFRYDSRGSVGSLSTSQFISIFIFVFGLALIIFEKQCYAFLDRVFTKKPKAKKDEDAPETFEEAEVSEEEPEKAGETQQELPPEQE